MKALDTNVLVRFLVCDDAPMTGRTRVLFEQARDTAQPLMISNLVLLETFWVLGYSYGFSRKAIIEAVDLLLTLPSVTFESNDVARDLVSMGQASTLDLPYILIGLQARALGADITLTFDKKAARSELFEEIA
jgi:predicted nucleic-acid-binding protein